MRVTMVVDNFDTDDNMTPLYMVCQISRMGDLSTGWLGLPGLPSDPNTLDGGCGLIFWSTPPSSPTKEFP